MAQRRTLTCQCEDLTSSSYNLHEKPHVVVDACNLSTVCVWQRVEVLDKRIYGDGWLSAELQVQKINVFQGSIVDSNRVLTSVYTTCAPYISNTHTHTHNISSIWANYDICFFMWYQGDSLLLFIFFPSHICIYTDQIYKVPYFSF